MVDRAALERILRVERSDIYSEDSDGWYSQTERGSVAGSALSGWESGASSIRSSETGLFSARSSREPPRGRSRERRPRTSQRTSSQRTDIEPPLEPIKAGDLPMVVRTATVQTDTSKHMSRSRSTKGGRKHQSYHHKYDREGRGSVDGDSYSSSGDSISTLSSLESVSTDRFSRSPTPDNSRAVPWSWNARNAPISRYTQNPALVTPGRRDLGNGIPMYGIPHYPTPGYDPHTHNLTNRSYPGQMAVGHPPAIQPNPPHYSGNYTRNDYIPSMSASSSWDGYDGSSDEGFFDDEGLYDAAYSSSSDEEYSDGDLYYD
ncbi:hypothetical protein BD779DRAFT_1667690 [Infundibulicybe gibba]|nr:hypothetical protein BD779DRAFT_1667690 [Infundibulicybe gibba]